MNFEKKLGCPILCAAEDVDPAAHIPSPVGLFQASEFVSGQRSQYALKAVGARLEHQEHRQLCLSFPSAPPGPGRPGRPGDYAGKELGGGGR